MGITQELDEKPRVGLVFRSLKKERQEKNMSKEKGDSDGK
jgi:hypothetical protein